jgi:hypothetical protein
MIVPAICNGLNGISLLDYAYLALNVYHNHRDDALIGFRPFHLESLILLKNYINNKNGWIQLKLPELTLDSTSGFYAELYVKIYLQKIQHIMVAFRGTSVKNDYTEDIQTWWKTVTAYTDNKANTPTYWPYATAFMQNCTSVISELDHMNLLADFCGHHITGHSLGGALANLVAAKAFICKPADISVALPNVPYVISFNAPGIGNMPGICDGFYEGQVISMRAQYDMISALGVPYGYVINNIIPEGYDTAKRAFNIERASESASLKQLLCNETFFCDSIERTIQTESTDAFLQQHSMANFLKMIIKHEGQASTTFNTIKSWAREHGGKNHDEMAECWLRKVA